MTEAGPQPTEQVDRLVVGAGIGGLADAWWAHRRGESVRVVEARDRVGGVIESERLDGLLVEWAASSVPSTAKHFAALMADLPTPPHLVPAAPAAKAQFLLRRRGLVPVPRTPKALLTSSALPISARVRALTEPLRPRRDAATRRHESLAAFVTRRFGRGITETFLRPFTNGIYGASPDRLGAADAFPVLVAMEQRYGSILKGLARVRRGRTEREILVAPDGMASIPEAIAKALGERVICGTPATQLTLGHRDRRPILTLHDGRRIQARQIVLAMPADAQARLLAPHAPAIAESLAAVPYVPLAVAIVGFARERGPTVPPGFGFLRAPDSKARILGATFRTHLHEGFAPPGHELLTVYLGGSEDPAFLEERDKSIRQQVLDDLESALGTRIRRPSFHLRRVPRAIPLFAPGHRGRMAALTAALLPHGVRLMGSHVTGVSLDQCVAPTQPLEPIAPQGAERVVM